MTPEGRLPEGSRAILIGVSAYEYAEFPPIRAARNSLDEMRSLLTDPALCGWPSGQVTVIANPLSAAGLATTIADLAEAATGTLLLYYVGHGVLSARGELCLTVTSSRPDRPKISGLPWDTVADVLRDCPARTRLAILDCCFAGQATQALAGDDDRGLADITHVEGVYTLTATTGNRTAHVPPAAQQDAACTSFTGGLGQLVRSGVAGGGRWLSFGDIYRELRVRLPAQGLPAPSQRGTDAARGFLFTANAAAPQPSTSTTRPPTIDTIRPEASADSGPAPPPAPQELTDSEPAESAWQARLLADALRAANSTADEASKARALVAIGSALATLDPPRAARLVVDAARVADSISDAGARGSALTVALGPLAAIDPDRAERAAHSITGDALKAQALAAVGGALATADPERATGLIAYAAQLAGAVSDVGGQAPALAAVAQALAVTDSDRAERVAQSIPDAGSRASALAGIAGGLAAADPDRSARLIADAERVAQSINGVTMRASALAAVTRVLAVTDPDRALRLTIDAERVAQSIPDPHRKAAALAAVAKALAVTDSPHAERLAQSITEAGSRATALAAVAEALDPGRPV